MSSSAPATTTPAQTGSHPGSFGDNKGIKFEIKTGNARWQCTLQDRGNYERVKAARTPSTDSTTTSSSSSTKSD